MVQFEEEDLFYNDYSNTIGDYPDYIAIEDLEILNLREKYHVIFFCDAYLKRYKLDKDIKSFQKVEKIIRTANQVILVKELFDHVEQYWVIPEAQDTEIVY